MAASAAAASSARAARPRGRKKAERPPPRRSSAQPAVLVGLASLLCAGAYHGSRLWGGAHLSSVWRALCRWADWPVSAAVVIDNALELRILRPSEISKLREILSDAAFDGFLGDWRYDEEQLRELNAKLATGQLARVAGFLDADLALKFHRELNAGADRGWFVTEGVGFNQSSTTEGEYLQHTTATARCSFLAQKDKRFKYQYHVAAPPSNDRVNPLDHPAIVKVSRTFGADPFALAMGYLLTGQAVPEGAAFYKPSVRLFQEGDYITLHDDVKDGDRWKVRVLGLNYYFSQGWRPEWGGTFLWCGDKTDKDSAAQRFTPQYNEAALFIPGPTSYHAVELVRGADAGARRFSFSSWLRIEKSQDARTSNRNRLES